MDGQSHARPDRDMPFATQPLGCDVMQQDREVRSVTGCYAMLDKQVSLRALTYTSQLHSKVPLNHTQFHFLVWEWEVHIMKFGNSTSQ
jgi:hypothetical protein